MSLPLIIAICSGLMLLGMGGFTVFHVLTQEKKRKSNMTRRLSVEEEKPVADEAINGETSSQVVTQEKTAKRALDLATGGDKEKVARIRRMLIRAGDFDPSSTAKFALSRFVAMGIGIATAFAIIFFYKMSILTTNGVSVLFGFAVGGYFVPTLMLNQKIKARQSEYRNGFPDFMDLMIVCADAGLSLDASVDRVSRELANTYPYLSHNLMTFSLELRAGRGINDAMKSFGDRVGLEEVDAFAVLLKQSKELGTSLSATLRVFSEEMRDKRMSAAEEKAHALPAKMTIPVTVCILPTVVMIAIIPIIVKLGG